MLITLTGNDDQFISQVLALLVDESELEISHVRLDGLLNDSRNVDDAELLILLTREQEPDNLVEWVSHINPNRQRVRRLVLCMPRSDARASSLLLKHANEIVSPAGFAVEYFVERVLGLLIQEKLVKTYNHGPLYGGTKSMRKVYADIEKYARLQEPVLILGETGTGKELVARAIHEASARSSETYGVCNCTTVPRDMAESHFFGHKRGAFTGAVSDFPGAIRTAHKGTLLLDEIGDLPFDLQPKLLRLLQENEIQPLGERKAQKVDVRFVFATARELRKHVDEGTFRRDLLARINRVVLKLPPLRERKADIPLLVEHFRNEFNTDNGKNVKIQPNAIDELFCIDWQENVRDLGNVIARAAADVGPDEIITYTLMSESLKLAGGYESASGQAAHDGPFWSFVFQPREDNWDAVVNRAQAAYFKAIIEVAQSEKEAFKLSGRRRAQFYEILGKHGLSFNHRKRRK